MTPGAQAPAEAREGYVTYDELPGPRLHAARWSPARLPLPTVASTSRWTPTPSWPSGRAKCGWTIPRFSLTHSAKHLVFSTRRFELPADRPATFAVDMAVRNIGREPAD
jgi:hypothetical protein